MHIVLPPFNDRCIPFPDNVWQRSKNKLHFHQQMQLTQAPTQHISWKNQQNLKIQLPLISPLLHSNRRITMIRIVSLIPFQFREQYGFQCLQLANFSPGGSRSGQFKKLKITGGKQTRIVYTQIGYSIMCSHNSTEKVPAETLHVANWCLPLADHLEVSYVMESMRYYPQQNIRPPDWPELKDKFCLQEGPYVV